MLIFRNISSLHNVPYYLHREPPPGGEGSGCNQIHRDLAISSIIGIFGLIVTTCVAFIPRLGYKSAFCFTAAAAAAFSWAFASIINGTQNLASLACSVLGILPYALLLCASRFFLILCYDLKLKWNIDIHPR